MKFRNFLLVNSTIILFVFFLQLETVIEELLLKNQIDKLEVTREWLISINLLVGSLCAIFAIFIYQNQQSWKRIEFAAPSVKQFRVFYIKAIREQWARKVF